MNGPSVSPLVIHGNRRRIWTVVGGRDRALHHYPGNAQRAFLSGVVVLATVMLFYEFSVSGAVGPSLISQFHMTFRFYVVVAVVSSVVGAFASLAGGLADRWGRAGLVSSGLMVTGLLTLFGLPNAPNKWVFLVLFALLGVAQGAVLVASSALVRDLSPQVQRASAMAFWSLGPVLGSLIVAEVSSHTLTHLRPWQDQFTICGVAGVVVAGVAWLFLRELSPSLRDQLMVSSNERALVEARAAGLDVSGATEHPWRQMLHADIIGAAFGISVFLLIYYVAVGFFVIYFTTVFGFTQAAANSVTNWFWSFEGGTLIVVGLLSDRLRVRKPFIAVGAVGAIVMTVIFLTMGSNPHTSHGALTAVVAILAVMLGLVTGPWMAAFTETVERRNPALTATGLAVWGWVSRIVIAGSTLVLPFVVTAATPLVDYGPRVQALATTYGPELATAAAVQPATMATLVRDPTNTAAQANAVAEVARTRHVTVAEAIRDLIALTKVPRADLAYLSAHGPEVKAAAAASPRQWQRWFWVCVGGEILFLPLILTLTGRWLPGRARADEERRAALIRESPGASGEGRTRVATMRVPSGAPAGRHPATLPAPPTAG
jgi:MFS family permease